MKIAATGDLHCRVYSQDLIQTILPNIEKQADALIIAGDLTDTGLTEEAEVLVNQLKRISIPVITVLGNHDFESGKADEIKLILQQSGIILLDSSTYEIGDVGFLGTKGFCGGFGKNLIQPFGEKALKRFVEAGLHESVELEKLLSRLESKHKVAVLHYSPVKETLNGESPELFAFLGDERLAVSLDRQGVDIILHGHAHHGSPEGHTSSGIPVYNVSRYVSDHYFHRAYCIFDLDGSKENLSVPSNQ